MASDAIGLFLQKSVKKLILDKRLIKKGDLLIVAVSGGVDSLSLLHILQALREEGFLSFSLFVAHLNHGLRGNSAREDAKFVCREAKKMGLPYKVESVDCAAFARRQGLSLEDAARHLRYRFLHQLAEKIGAARVAVGHTREDQVETLLLNFLRGTGLPGLTGMRMERKFGTGGLYYLIRPFLKTSRADLERYCREKELSPRWDETNLETQFLRNKIRLKLLPFLEKEFNPNLRQSMEHLAELLLCDHNYLQAVAARRFSRLLVKAGSDRLEIDGRALLYEHAAMQGRILRLAVNRLIGVTPREIGYNQIQAILNLIRKGSPHGSLHLPFGLEAAKSYSRLKLHLRKKTVFPVLTPFKLLVPGEKVLPGGKTTLKAELSSRPNICWSPGRDKAYLDYDKVIALLQGTTQTGVVKNNGNQIPGNPAGEGKRGTLAADIQAELLVRARKAGDFFHPLGAPGKKKLKKYFIDQKIPLEKRMQIPLVLAGGEIIWVAGQQVGHNCRLTGETKSVLVLKLIRHEGKVSR